MSDFHSRLASGAFAVVLLAWFGFRDTLRRVDDNLADF